MSFSHVNSEVKHANSVCVCRNEYLNSKPGRLAHGGEE